MTMELLGTIGITALIFVLVGANIALTIWDWRKKRAQARLEAGAEAWGEAFGAMAKREVERTDRPGMPSAVEVARRAATAPFGLCGGVLDGFCHSCPGIDPCGGRGFCQHGDPDASKRRAAAHAWLADHGIPVEAPAGEEAQS